MVAAPSTESKVDQVGYLPGSPKVAFVVSNSANGECTCAPEERRFRHVHGKTPVRDQDSPALDSTADFWKLEESGVYYLAVSGVGRSWCFSIGPDVYRQAFSRRGERGFAAGLAESLRLSGRS